MVNFQQFPHILSGRHHSKQIRRLNLSRNDIYTIKEYIFPNVFLTSKSILKQISTVDTLSRRILSVSDRSTLPVNCGFHEELQNSRFCQYQNDDDDEDEDDGTVWISCIC